MGPGRQALLASVIASALLLGVGEARAEGPSPPAFRTGGPGIEIVQRDGSEDRVIATIALAGGVRQILQQGDRLYVVPEGEGLLVFDVGDPVEPRQTATLLRDRRIVRLTEHEGGVAAGLDDGTIFFFGTAAPPQPGPAPGQKGSTDSGLLFKVGAGFVYRWAFNENFVGGTAEITLGGRSGPYAGGAWLSAEVGTIVSGLTFGSARIGPSFEYRFTDRLRLDLGLAFGLLFIRRATLGNGDLIGGIIGVRTELALDLVKGGRGALYLGLRPEVEFMGAVDLPIPSFVMTTLLGYRY